MEYMRIKGGWLVYEPNFMMDSPKQIIKLIEDVNAMQRRIEKVVDVVEMIENKKINIEKLLIRHKKLFFKNFVTGTIIILIVLFGFYYFIFKM